MSADLPLLSPVEALEAIAALHVDLGYIGDFQCSTCDQLWPCETRRILNRVDFDAVEVTTECDDLCEPPDVRTCDKPKRRVETWRGPWTTVGGA